MLLVDGHNSHYTLELLEYARKHNIVIICYPAHTTHVLQGLDVVCFGAFKTFWTQETIRFERETGLRVQKENFLTPLSRAYVQGFTVTTVKKAFEKTGTWPFKRNAITAKMIAPSKETSIESHLPIEVPTLLQNIAQTIPFMTHSEGAPSPVKVWYTPTKTRTLNIDPALLAAAEIRNSLEDSSLSFLVSSSPIHSSSTLPPLTFEQIPPLPPLLEQLLDIPPETSQAAELQHALRESQDREYRILAALTVERTRLVLADMHLGRIKRQLYAKEEKKKKKNLGRLMGDGLPRLLTGDAFVALSREYRDAQEVAALDKAKKAEEKVVRSKLQACWKVEQAKVDAANAEALRSYQGDLAKWKEEQEAARLTHKRPARTKPIKPKKIPALPKIWVKKRPRKVQNEPVPASSVMDEALDEEESSSDMDSSDDGSGE